MHLSAPCSWVVRRGHESHRRQRPARKVGEYGDHTTRGARSDIGAMRLLGLGASPAPSISRSGATANSGRKMIQFRRLDLC